MVEIFSCDTSCRLLIRGGGSNRTVQMEERHKGKKV